MPPGRGQRQGPRGFSHSVCAGPCVDAGSRAIWSRECWRGWWPRLARWPGSASHCASGCASVSSVCASVSVAVRERVLPHVPLGALGVAVVWPGLSRHTPISTLPGASLVATAICLMRRCGYIHQRTLSVKSQRRPAARMRRRGFSGAGSGGLSVGPVAAPTLTPRPVPHVPERGQTRSALRVIMTRQASSRWLSGESRTMRGLVKASNSLGVELRLHAVG